MGSRLRGGVSLGRKLSVIALVYVIEGFPMGVHDLWPIYLRRHDVSLAESLLAKPARDLIHPLVEGPVSEDSAVVADGDGVASCLRNRGEAAEERLVVTRHWCGPNTL